MSRINKLFFVKYFPIKNKLLKITLLICNICRAVISLLFFNMKFDFGFITIALTTLYLTPIYTQSTRVHPSLASNHLAPSIKTNNDTPLYDVHCPICWESLNEIFPSFFNCTHNFYHTSCIFKVSNDNEITPRVSKCPVCKANIKTSEKYINESTVISLLESTQSTLQVLSTRNVEEGSFPMILNEPPELQRRVTREFLPISTNYPRISFEEHNNNLMLLSRHMYKNFTLQIQRKLPTDNQVYEYTELFLNGEWEALKLIRLLRVKNWSAIRPVFMIALVRNFPNRVLKDLVQMGQLHSDHVE